MGRKATDITHGLKQYSIRRNGNGTMEDGLKQLQKNAYNKGRDDGRKESMALAGAATALGTLVTILLSLKEKITKPEGSQELPEASESNTNENPVPEDEKNSEEETEDSTVSIS